jgi:hypothetical protein
MILGQGADETKRRPFGVAKAEGRARGKGRKAHTQALIYRGQAKPRGVTP